MELLDCLKEAVELIEAIREGEYKPDSLTTQPWKEAIQKSQVWKEKELTNMCFSNKCPYEQRSGECGKRAWQVCPESFETSEEADKAADEAAELAAEHEWNRQNEEGPWV